MYPPQRAFSCLEAKNFIEGCSMWGGFGMEERQESTP
jgi:hypothetical protein